MLISIEFSNRFLFNSFILNLSFAFQANEWRKLTRRARAQPAKFSAAVLCIKAGKWCFFLMKLSQFTPTLFGSNDQPCSSYSRIHFSRIHLTKNKTITLILCLWILKRSLLNNCWILNTLFNESIYIFEQKLNASWQIDWFVSVFWFLFDDLFWKCRFVWILYIFK